MKRPIEEITSAAAIAQQLILELHDTDPENKTFEQVGLLDGQNIIEDFIDNGEWGCALDHLLYMVHESTILFPRGTMLRLHEIARSYGIQNYYSKENLVHLICILQFAAHF
jgi:hypothetical protein